MMAKYPLLSSEDCGVLVANLSGVNWEDGTTPSLDYLKNVKSNYEIDMGADAFADEPMTNIINAIMACQFFLSRAIPKNLARPRLSLYRDGSEYKNHADAAFTGQDPELRADISVSVFLSDPNTYEGGELVLEFPSGMTMTLKEPQGTVLFYPSGVVQRINPVTEGERLTFDAWVESHIQDPQKRDILVEITAACADMEGVDYMSDLHVRMTNVKHNLYRLWMKKT